MSNPTKFVLVIPVSKPTDFVPSGFAVYNEEGQLVILGDGSVVEVVGPVTTEVEDECVIQYRKVRTTDGFVGRVVWVLTDGKHSGFEPICSHEI